MVKTRKQAQDEVEALFSAVTTNWERFPGDDDHEREANVIIDEINAARKGDDAKRAVQAMMAVPTLKTVIIRMVYSEDDASDIPIKYLKHCLEHPARIQQFYVEAQRRSINGPNKAIRTKCLECQGQDTAGVRQCPVVTCQLWPFRMSGNPFFGRMRGAEDEVTDAEVEADYALEDARDAEREQANADQTA